MAHIPLRLMARRGLIVALLTLFAGTLSAQEYPTTTIDTTSLSYTYTPFDPNGANKRGKTGQRVLNYLSGTAPANDKRVRFSFIGGPGYSTETSLRLGVLGQMSYRIKGADLAAQPSTAALSASVSITGYYRIALTGDNFFRNGKHRLSYRAEFRSLPTKFWGLSFDAALHNPVGRYTSKRYLVLARYSYALTHNTYIGAYADYRYLNTIKPDANAVAALGYSRPRASAAGIGINLAYDSRDITTNATKGIYAAVEAILRPAFTNNIGDNLWQLSATLDYYQPLWKGGTLAIDIYGEFHSAQTPWLLRSELGDDNRMRGYYPGRFNGNNLITVQAELRQRIWQRLGCAVWGGAGTTFSVGDEFKWAKVLPTYGAGLRWELNQHTHIRFDAGFGRDSYAFVLAFNEAF